MDIESAEWTDLTEVWQSDEPSIAVDMAHLQNRMRRQRFLEIAIAGTELTSALVGVGIALWFAIYTRFAHLGWLLAILVSASAAVAIRGRRVESPLGALDVLATVDAVIALQDRTLRFLDIGRAVGFSSLTVIVMFTSRQLQYLGRTFESSPQRLLLLLAGGAYVLAVMLWGTLLARQTRRRRDRLRALRDQLNLPDQGGKPLSRMFL